MNGGKVLRAGTARGPEAGKPKQDEFGRRCASWRGRFSKVRTCTGSLSPGPLPGRGNASSPDNKFPRRAAPWCGGFGGSWKGSISRIRTRIGTMNRSQNSVWVPDPGQWPGIPQPGPAGRGDGSPWIAGLKGRYRHPSGAMKTVCRKPRPMAWAEECRPVGPGNRSPDTATVRPRVRWFIGSRLLHTSDRGW